MSNLTKHNIGFSLKGMEIIELQLIHPEKAIPKDIIYDFEIDIKHRLNIENGLVFVICNVDVFIETDLKVGQLKLNCAFHFTSIKNLLSKDEKLNLPEDVVVTINSIAISTVRGVMFSEFKGTFLHNAMIPLVDPKGFSLK